jgi:hypothetical protein
MQRFNFDRFMDTVVLQEKQKKRLPEQEETPQRALVKRHAESPANRTRFVPKGSPK